MNTFRLLVTTLLLTLLAGCVTAPVTNPREQAALTVLSSSADLHEKARACQELGVVGGPASVAALAALLDDERLSDYARSGLEGIRDPSAGLALRSALPKLSDRRLIGVVNSLGMRREKAAVAELAALARDSQRGAAPQAVAALGAIGNPDAAKALQQLLANGPADLRVPAAHAALVAAEHLAREGDSAAARRLLAAVVSAQPSEHITRVAQNQATALRGR